MSKRDLDVWFKERHKWLQEAAKQLFEKDCLDDKDINELKELCLKEAVGDTEDFESVYPVNVFGAAAYEALRLSSIGDVININALAPREPLNFGGSNLSVIYGQNGSGKSGYVRILKHVCGARYPGTLHSNVYSSEESQQQCTITFKKGETVIPYQWVADSGVIEDLRSVDIFDTSFSHAYVATENEVTYEPPELSFFSDLISICERVTKDLDAEEGKHASKKPILPSDYDSTVPGKWYANLTKDISVIEIGKHCIWKDTDDKELMELEKRLFEQSPSDKANQLRTQKQHIDTLIKEAEEYRGNFSDENCQTILEAKKQSLVKEKAAKLAAERLFKSAPLKGVGTEVWVTLWEQARIYSQREAYKDNVFPWTGEESRCVLCQQPLLDEAKELLQSFDEFIKGESQKAAVAAKRKYDEALEKIGELPSAESIETKAAAAGLTQKDDIRDLKNSYDVLRSRKGQLSQVDSIDKIDKLPQLEEWLKMMRIRSSEREKSAQKYEKDAKEDKRDELTAKLLEMRANKWLSEQQKPVGDEIDRLKYVDVLRKAKRLTDTTVLSRKKGELAEELITAEFVRRFSDELKELGAAHIKIELVKTRVDKGRVLHRLRLQGAERGSPKEILSEGEYKIVALAAFFADVAEKDNVAPFVFDDPISSLDQDYELAVVRRLVKLALDRQVVVFTHRLSLLGMIQDYGKKAGYEPNMICVRQEEWGAGEPGGTPIFAKKPDKALNYLLNERLAKARKKLKEEGREQYDPSARSICTDYRIILERMVEYVLLADVVQRHRRAINTEGKIDKLKRITEADCKFIDEMMTKYSQYEHSQSDEAPVVVPDPDEIQQDIEKLQQWREEFVRRDGE